ncbi:MAG TPA: CDP-diacylglycerol--serine O-phosphatidyltransferase [Bacteroidales bacterium]|nr:CDP-diacylglycerol--serine O-phosphatidyltransferase [Bacteroidales bacterium]
MKRGLPSFFTSLGLISGCISIVFSIAYGNLTLAGYFILIAAFFDFIDGFTARMVNAISDFGKQLDSLADVVSFGVAPSMIIYQIIELAFVQSSTSFDKYNPTTGQHIILFSSFILAVFSALRLAKFNLDPGQSKSFRGLPVPANAIFFAGIGFIVESNVWLSHQIVSSVWILLALVVLFSYLQVSNIRMFSLKFSSYGFKANAVQYLFLLVSAVLLVLFHLPALSPIIVLYVLVSVVTIGKNK